MIRRDMAVIAGKCLEKDRNLRYSTASELSADIRRFLDGDVVMAAIATGIIASIILGGR